jgi:hypothetical protein
MPLPSNADGAVGWGVTIGGGIEGAGSWAATTAGVAPAGVAVPRAAAVATAAAASAATAGVRRRRILTAVLSLIAYEVS